MSVRDAPARSKGLPEEFELAPLPGHTGVAVHNGERWLLHCGDAQHREIEENPEPHPVLDVVQTRAAADHDDRVGSQSALRRLARDHKAEITLFSAHDPQEFDRLKRTGPEGSATA
ncbi:hypothetical protein [Lentzea sp. NBRC 102530]|uniref:hypothetical protein n=1 Tax=Lentzea sp. NBRC 102530 TaxID=3032201 RepID=UPI0024A3E20D|nr:hypothetical protein [Lentzea sp. NBRC 102530]GLY51478.1 hypothetical protein Lesp01_51340 [Lentzea sp. NBRC 102530]